MCSDSLSNSVVLHSLSFNIPSSGRSLDAGLNNKANELQEDISMKRFDVRVMQMHLGALKAQVRGSG